MAQRAYEGPVVTGSIKIGAQALLIGNTGVADPSAKITDITTPPTGYRYCGSLNENKAEVTSKKEIFSLKTGIPETTKMQEVVGVEAQIKAVLNEWSIKNLWESMGQPTLIHTIGAGTAGTIEATTTRTVLKVGTGEVAALAIAAGDMVVISTDGTKTSSSNIEEVKSVDAVADTITLNYALEQIPANGLKVNHVTGTKFAFGDTGIHKVKAILVFDAKDGTQIQHIVPECAMLGEYTPTMSDTKKNVALPVTLEAYGVNDAEFGKLVVIKPLVFHKNE